MASLRKRLKRKDSRFKGRNNHNPKPNDKQEEAARKSKEENSRKIAEASKTVEEEENRKKEEAILEKATQIQKDIGQETLNTELGIEDTREPT